MTQIIFTELIRDTTGCDAPAAYVKMLIERAQGHAASGRQVTARDYHIMAKIVQETFDNLDEGDTSYV